MKVHNSGGRDNDRRKKAYRKPETLSRERLEALAVVCDTGKSNSFDCMSGPIQS